MNLEELAVIHDALYDIVHVVSFVRVIRNDLIQGIIHAAYRVICRNDRSLLHIVLRNVAQQFLDDSDTVLVILSCEMSHATLCRMHARTAEIF